MIIPELHVMKPDARKKEDKNFDKKLFAGMKERNLVGELTFQDHGVLICWRISDYKIEIGREYIGVSKKMGSFFLPIMHWHPDDEEIFEVLCNIGTKGNVTVIHNGWFEKSILYIGSKKDCPYQRKRLFGIFIAIMGNTTLRFLFCEDLAFGNSGHFLAERPFALCITGMICYTDWRNPGSTRGSESFVLPLILKLQYRIRAVQRGPRVSRR